MTEQFDVVADGLAFPEGPRWHDGALWFSDMQGGTVYRVTPGQPKEQVVEVPNLPSGLGFLPDGRLLVVSMHDRKVLRLDPDGLHEHADLSQVASWHTNDMLVDPQGRAYVGTFGDASAPPDPVTPANLALIAPDGAVSVAATDMHLANGMALTDGGRTLVVAETRALPPRITAFDVADDGSLSGRRVLIELTNELPDGICADADDNIWFASPFTGEVIKVDTAGQIVARIRTPQAPYACALGGEDGQTLFICASDTWIPEQARAALAGQVFALRVNGG
ncbi:SMP-30/gluconolactonase/LRE family protein [Nakamurella lactea]|jgi:sugar lactone lactonase YvrE|uniref:SMP-30/gluconolactonase/LRE family protein n=1 Tax=Nakamurella lactea TaxID=459515 RepID=UPI00040C8CA3|nr:SMP-30/gluconolactonase/LRE family protein [Nakamurella lactea]